MKTIQFIAACALLASAGATFGHEDAGHGARAAPASAAATASAQTAWGRPGNAADVQRTIVVGMTDAMRFAPHHMQVREGETVRLRADNQGQLLHEIVLGTQADLDTHAAQMRQHPGMAHSAPSMAHVAPGQQGDIVWQFNRPGQFDFACLIEGHYQAGMTGTITVLPRSH